MRKWIIAAVVAVALFSIGAFAASFTLTAQNVSSGAAPVNTCATQPTGTGNTVTWNIGQPTDQFTPPSTPNWTVIGATVTVCRGRCHTA